MFKFVLGLVIGAATATVYVCYRLGDDTLSSGSGDASEPYPGPAA